MPNIRHIRKSVTIAILAALALTGIGERSVAAPPPGDLELVYAGDLFDPTHVADTSGKGLHGAIVTGGGGTVTSVAAPGPLLRTSSE